MNILLTSVGRRTYIVDYFKETLGNKGKVIATNSSHTYALSRADISFISPIIYSNEYIPFIVDICKKEKVDAILSLFDIDLPILAENQDVFEKIGTRYIGPSYETAIIGNDKLRTYEFFKSSGLKTPKTFFSYEEVKDLLNDKTVRFPLMVKPRWGMGSISVNIVRTMEELTVLYTKCLFDIENSYLKYESSAELDKAVTIQEFIKGQEYGLDIYKDLSGKFLSIISKKKVAMRSGETDIGEIVDNEKFQKFAEIAANGLDFSGLLSLDCFLNGDTVYGIEINPRISGHYPFSHIAGANYPLQLIKWLNSEETDISLLSAKIGVMGCKELTPTILSLASKINT